MIRIFIVTLFAINLSFAQDHLETSPEAIALLSIDQTNSIEEGKYQLENQNSFKIDGVEYLQFDFKKSNQLYNLYNERSCPHSNSNLNNVLLKSTYVTANLGSSLLAAYELSNVKWDKAKHFYAGYIVGNLSTGGFQLLIPKDTPHRKLKIFIAGSLTSALVGVGKEYLDSVGYGHVQIKNSSVTFGYGNVDAKDALATFMGGVTGSISFSLIDLKKKLPHKSVAPLLP